jgi:hypothetical protein
MLDYLVNNYEFDDFWKTIEYAAKYGNVDSFMIFFHKYFIVEHYYDVISVIVFLCENKRFDILDHLYDEKLHTFGDKELFIILVAGDSYDKRFCFWAMNNGCKLYYLGALCTIKYNDFKFAKKILYNKDNYNVVIDTQKLTSISQVGRPIGTSLWDLTLSVICQPLTYNYALIAGSIMDDLELVNLGLNEGASTYLIPMLISNLHNTDDITNLIVDSWKNEFKTHFVSQWTKIKNLFV